MEDLVPYSACLIRCALKAEIPQIEELGIDSYAEYRDKVPPELYAAYSHDLRNLARYWDEAVALVADLDGKIAGSVLFYADASTEGLGLPSHWAGFRKLAVRPSARGFGVGRALIEACTARASERGAATIGIHTASIMKAACRLYDVMGFERSPQYDLSASTVLGIDGRPDDIAVLAYRLDLAAGRSA